MSGVSGVWGGGLWSCVCRAAREWELRHAMVGGPVAAAGGL